MKKYKLETIVFLGGAIGMGLELIAARVLSPYVGSSNVVWCEQNNVNIKSYYYYLAKLRKMAIEQIPYKKRNNVLPLVPESNDIVEIQAPQSTPVCISSSVMTICQGNTKIEINSNCPEWMIRELLNKYVR